VSPKHEIDECVEKDLTFASPLYVSVLLAGPEVPEPIKQEIFLGDFPEMTEKGTFIVNGTERVVVSQLIRSPGVYFEAPVDRTTGRRLAMAKLIPDRGAWMEFETRKNDYLILKFNRKRTVPITIFLRALAAIEDGIAESPVKEGSDEELLALFQDVDNNPDRLFIPSTMRQEPVWDLTGGQTIAEAALLEFFKRMRPGDPATLENARQFLEEQLFDQRHYDLERVGRYKLNQKLDLQERIPVSHRTITRWDVVYLVRRMIMINNEVEDKDDIDHLGNRRVKTVGELIQNKLRIGLRRMERVIKERMSIRDQDQVTPVGLVNIRPVVAALREFFGSSQLSQFMDQTNPLAELRHKRTLSALGPGGLRRERAGFDVRDVHHSHYGRICPIETPEGPNIGLIGRLASFARVNEYGFIETPYRRVVKALSTSDARLENRTLRETLTDPDTGEVLLREGERVTAEHAACHPQAQPRHGVCGAFRLHRRRISIGGRRR
jgi:DNA-directed RNA polymerase subunit beta